MSKENKKLGMGLGALLSPSIPVKGNINKIDISKITPNKQQPRKNFDENEVKELSNSIKNQGLIQPIVVRETGNDSYEKIAGERRWRAAQLVGIHEVPVIIKVMDDEQALQAALIENIQRENLNPVEEAKAYQSILKLQDMSYEKLSKLIGKSTSHISNIIRLLELDIKILEYLEEKYPGVGHALLPKDIVARQKTRRAFEVISCDTQPLSNLGTIQALNKIQPGAGKEFATNVVEKGVTVFEKIIDDKGPFVLF